MKVLFLHDYGTLVGGAERSVLMLRDGLRCRGHDTKILAAGRMRGGEGPQHADIVCRGADNDRAAAVLRVANLDAQSKVRAAIREFQPDIVHARMVMTQLSPLVLRALGDVPVVHHVSWYRTICPRGTKLLPNGTPCRVDAGVPCLRNGCVTAQSWPLDMAQLRLYRRWRKNIDATVAVSHTVARRLHEAGMGPVTVIENAVDALPAREPLSGPPRLCFAGRLVPEKGVDVLLAAMAQMSTRGVVLDVAGAGPDSTTLRTQCSQLNLDDRVTFHGHLRGPELQAVLNRAWIQVVPNRWEEPFGNAVTEAMARGTVVVASNSGGPAEILEDGVTGILTDPGNVSALAAAMAELASDRDRCETMGAAGRRVARTRFAVDRLLDECEELYVSILGKQR